MRSLVHSYLFLRQAIGVIGIGLPIVLIVGYLLWPQHAILASISGYYYSPLRGVFVGSMCAVGVFLLSYRGTEVFEDIVADVAGVAAIGVALFPTTPSGNASSIQQAVADVHMACAAVFFVMLAFFCLFRFPRTDYVPAVSDPHKRQRDIVYYLSGGVILLCLALVWAASWIPATESLHPLLWLETAAILSFGVAWFTKGREPLPPDAATEATPSTEAPQQTRLGAQLRT
ncbi:MAG TPA: DUF998 domain-containing protein [Pseudonocardiaceae bacterium]|nr:DUF998 domain-containing protein [Pseudonocardiaceae bacterium]